MSEKRINTLFKALNRRLEEIKIAKQNADVDIPSDIRGKIKQERRGILDKKVVCFMHGILENEETRGILQDGIRRYNQLYDDLKVDYRKEAEKLKGLLLSTAKSLKAEENQGQVVTYQSRKVFVSEFLKEVESNLSVSSNDDLLALYLFVFQKMWLS